LSHDKSMVVIIFDHIFLVYEIVDGVNVVFIIYNLLRVLILKGDLKMMKCILLKVSRYKMNHILKLFTLIHDHFTRFFHFAKALIFL
jgi:hypothetical protein